VNGVAYRATLDSIFGPGKFPEATSRTVPCASCKKEVVVDSRYPDNEQLCTECSDIVLDMKEKGEL
jgi:DNA-directed RNA polymerase subunit RPC12/RpoP